MMKRVCPEDQDPKTKLSASILFPASDLSEPDLQDVHACSLWEVDFGPVSPDCLLCFLSAH